MSKRLTTSMTLTLLVCESAAIGILLSELLILRLRLQGAWFLMLPLLTYSAGLAGVYVFPPLVILSLVLAYKSRLDLTPKGKLMLVVLVAWTLLLVAITARIDKWQRKKAKEIYAERFGATPPEELLKKTTARQSLPDVSLTSLDGHPTQLYGLIKGHRVNVVFFWQSYDAPWSRNLDTAQHIEAEFANQGVEVVGVNVQEPVDTAKTLIQERGITFPVVRDSEGGYFQSLQLMGSIEQMFLLGADGNIIHSHPIGF